MQNLRSLLARPNYNNFYNRLTIYYAFSQGDRENV